MKQHMPKRFLLFQLKHTIICFNPIRLLHYQTLTHFCFHMYLVYILGQILWRMKDHVHTIQQARIKQSVTHTSTVIPKKGTIHQPLNHFDRKNDKTFPQVQFIDATLHSHSSLNVISSEWHKNKKYVILKNVLLL